MILPRTLRTSRTPHPHPGELRDSGLPPLPNRLPLLLPLLLPPAVVPETAQQCLSPGELVFVESFEPFWLTLD